MSICEKPSEVGGGTSAGQVDDHNSEAAKVKRTRDQAYYNSYDFDAIEELPFDDDTDTVDGENNPYLARTLPMSKSCSPQRRRCQENTPLSPEESNANNTGSNAGHPHSGWHAAYLQRLGSFLVPTPVTEIQYHQRTPIQSDGKSQASDHLKMSAASFIEKQTLFASSNTEHAAEMNHSRNFLLPRAILKYQSGISNSMSPASVTMVHGAGGVKLLQNASNSSSRTSNHGSSRSTSTTTTANNNSKKTIIMSSTRNAFTPASSEKMRPRYDDETGFLTMMEIATTTTPAPTTSPAPQPPPPAMCKANPSHDSTGTTAAAASLASAGHKDATSGATRRIATAQKARINLECASSSATLVDNNRRRQASSHQSHYSTDKSGSSGYYSSNVCSTYSLEDHIYCEPVIDVLDLSSNSKSVVGGRVADSNTIIMFAKRQQQQQKLLERQQLQQQNQQKLKEKPQQMLKQTTTVSVNRSSSSGSTAEKHCEAESDSKMRNTNDRVQSKRYVGVRNGIDDDADEAKDDNGRRDNDEIARKKIQWRRMEKVEPLRICRNLRILETSIENLDRHLKNYPNMGAQEEITSFMQSHNTYLPQIDVAERGRAYSHLPTIMEGYVPASEPRPWPDEIADDSLLDIDLDSFLLVDERKDVRNKHIKTRKSNGVDNATFLTDELEENNYKCAKYINSCPEDAYRVESDIIAGSAPRSEKSTSVDHILKRYEDQLHFQNTRELLEDVRDKIRLLSQSGNQLHSNSVDSHHMSGIVADDEIPKELQSMILRLKKELESYLERMNQHSELEIRQLCSGLVKNQHIVKIKNAFDRRYSTTSLNETEYDFSTYEAIREGILLQPNDVPQNIRNNIASIRCVSDPNFKMKRRSLADAFPVTSCSIKSIVGNHIAPLGVESTQLQRNLSFQSPILNQLDPNIGSSENLSANALRGYNGVEGGDKESILEWHRKKPSIWEMYYGTNRMSQSLLGKRIHLVANCPPETMSYPSSRPESDFTLDLPRAEQLRVKMEKEKKFRQRCRYITTFLSLVFFLLTVMVVSLVLTRGKRMFGSMI